MCMCTHTTHANTHTHTHTHTLTRRKKRKTYPRTKLSKKRLSHDAERTKKLDKSSITDYLRSDCTVHRDGQKCLYELDCRRNLAAKLDGPVTTVWNHRKKVSTPINNHMQKGHLDGRMMLG